jgi:hypothetical protein
MHVRSIFSPGSVSRRSGGPPLNPGLPPAQGKSKDHDFEFGFDMFKLSKKESS